MAIYHLRLAPVKKAGTAMARSAHHGGLRLTSGATGKAAYLSGQRLNAPDGLVVDYRSKADGVEYSQLILPDDGTTSREQLWNAIDSHPTQRETADIAYDMIVAFPHELSFTERKEAALALARWIAERYRVAVDLGMHKPEIHNGSDQRNFHGHYLISHRRVSSTGEIGLVNRDFNHLVCTRVDEKRGRNERQKTAVAEIREAWQAIANGMLERGGYDERIDFRSYKDRKIDREPTQHLGPVETKKLRERERIPLVIKEIWGNECYQTLGSLLGELAAIKQKLASQIKEISEQIAKAEEKRKIKVTNYVLSSGIGNVEHWLYNPLREFLRTWEAADRVSAYQRRLCELQQTQQVRVIPATKQSTSENRRAHRILSRLEKLHGRLENATQNSAGLDLKTLIKVEQGPQISATLSAIERAFPRQKTNAPPQPSPIEQGVNL